jgi:hypothetical protein
MGLIVLIYKGGGQPRADPNSYRPITLLNCDVKIAAKKKDSSKGTGAALRRGLAVSG